MICSSIFMNSPLSEHELLIYRPDCTKNYFLKRSKSNAKNSKQRRKREMKKIKYYYDWSEFNFQINCSTLCGERWSIISGTVLFVDDLIVLVVVFVRQSIEQIWTMLALPHSRALAHKHIHTLEGILCLFQGITPFSMFCGHIIHTMPVCAPFICLAYWE